jgi:hypothetical protein
MCLVLLSKRFFGVCCIDGGPVGEVEAQFGRVQGRDIIIDEGRKFLEDKFITGPVTVQISVSFKTKRSSTGLHLLRQMQAIC